MTADQFTDFWNSVYPGTLPIPHDFKYDYSDRWFRIHSLPGSKRYPENDEEWQILLGRQNEIISDLLRDSSRILFVTGEFTSENHIELHPLEKVHSITNLSFTLLDPMDLHELNPEEYETGQYYLPRFSEQNWEPGKFDEILKDIADDNLRAFIVSTDKVLVVAPYDGGMDFILEDTKTRDAYKAKYSDWLSSREDGL